VFIASNTVWRPPAEEFLPYVVSKAALIGIARSLAKPLDQQGSRPPHAAGPGDQAVSSTSSSGSVDRISGPPGRTTTSSSSRTPPTPAL
jgi:hypothetical protein